MTMKTDFQQRIAALLPNIKLHFDAPLAKHTSFRIGGNAEVIAFPSNGEELATVLKASNLLDCKPVILGAGSNVLAPDEGLAGLVICLKDLDGMEQLSENTVRIMSGVTMARAAVYVANLGLSGLEFAHGIPGTVGGGVYMNAGAYGGEIAQVCKQVAVMDLQGNMTVLSGGDMEFSYRHSCLKTNGGVVVYVDFVLTPAPAAQIRATMRTLMEKRTASQPLEYPSAGSAFKRPAGGYAAALIDQCGLKGYRVGGAAVSEKHAGFVINVDNARAADVKQLLTQVSDIVFKETGIRLEPEVLIW